jgi:hypothetical protein
VPAKVQERALAMGRIRPIRVGCDDTVNIVTEPSAYFRPATVVEPAHDSLEGRCATDCRRQVNVPANTGRVGIPVALDDESNGPLAIRPMSGCRINDWANVAQVELRPRQSQSVCHDSVDYPIAADDPYIRMSSIRCPALTGSDEEAVHLPAEVEVVAFR